MKRVLSALTVALLAMLWLGVADPCEAAYINEVFFDDGGGSTGMPHAVELGHLDSLTSAEVDLIVIDARPENFGTVQRVVTIPTDAPIVLVSERDWPEDLWGPDSLLGDSRFTLAELGASDTFRFFAARSLLLYDRATRVRDDTFDSLFSPAQQERLDGAVLLDALTFLYPGSTADTDAPGPSFEVAAGHAIVRPMLTDTLAADWLLAGEVTAGGLLAGVEPPLALTPGLMNPVWEPQAVIPEPAVALWLALAMGAMLVQRPRHCSPGRRRLS